MANTARKKKTKKKTTTKRKRKARRPSTPKSIAAAVNQAANELQVKGGQLVVRLSRESHPEVFEIDRLCKTIHKLMDTHAGNRKCRDLCEFLGETEKGLQIILRNHLEQAMRKYLE